MVNLAVRGFEKMGGVNSFVKIFDYDVDLDDWAQRGDKLKMIAVHICSLSGRIYRCLQAAIDLLQIHLMIICMEEEGQFMYLTWMGQVGHRLLHSDT